MRPILAGLSAGLLAAAGPALAAAPGAAVAPPTGAHPTGTAGTQAALRPKAERKVGPHHRASRAKSRTRTVSPRP